MYMYVWHAFVCVFAIYSLLIVPQAGPDTKYLLAFIRTQMSTTVTIGFVFGSKVNEISWAVETNSNKIPN